MYDPITVFERSPRIPVLAGACETTARVLWTQRSRREASRLLARSHDLYMRCEASANASRVIDLFPALGLRRPRPRTQPSTGWESLTPSELRVIAGVRAGHTNQRIAERLGLSRRTVEAHLTRVYNKLGFRSRVELAVAAERAS